MSFKEFEAVRTEKVAGPQHETKSKNSVLPSTSSTPSPSPSTISATQEELHLQIYKIFPFIEISYRDLHRFISGLCKSVISSQLMQTINKYKNGCNENYTKVLESYDMCYKLSQNIVRTIDIFKELSTYLSDMEEYNYRLCEIMSIFIVCELRLSVDADQQEQHLIAQRIIYTMRKHLVQEDEYETLYNILRTLVYIPKLFNARDIMCAIFGEFIPLKPLSEVNVFPDKLYMLYIIVFYRWMMMQKDGEDKLLIVNFAESFMKPSVSLCTNNLYCPYLPMYTTHSTATRTILNNLKYYRDVRNASIIDNALKRNGVVVNLCDDEEDDIIIIGSPTTDFAQIFASVRGRGNIKLEEKTVVEMVDLTEEEEHITYRIELHDKWLNEFHKLAKQYRESQLLFEKQLNNQLISNGEEGAVICLDSDSEGEEEISSNINKETTTTATQENNTEDLFVDNYPITNTPLNCDSDLDPFDAEDENDVTKISPRFLSGSLRTYPAKRSNLLETEDKIAEQTTEDKITEETANKITDSDEQYTSEDLDKIYRRDSIHISSPPKGSQIEEEDEGTDVQDENDDGESQSDTFLPTTIQTTEKEIRPMGPYPTYGNMRNDNPKTKTPKKQKKRVQFNNDPLGPTSSSVLPILPLKPAIQQTAHKSSDSTENYRLHGFNRFTGAPNNDDDTNSVHLKSTDSVESYRIRGFNRYDDENSVLSSASSTSSIKQQEPTNSKCNNETAYNIKNVNYYDNKCSNLYKNLSVFKQKTLNIKKCMKNVKINLKKLNLDKDISLTNIKSSLINKEQQHTSTLTFIKSNLNSNNNNNFTYTSQNEPCQLKTNLRTSATNNNDDLIFKKPLPVTKRAFKTTKALKITKLLPPKRHLYNSKRRATIKAEAKEVLNILKVPSLVNETTLKNFGSMNEKHEPSDENKINLKSVAAHDNLSKISKILTDRINSLTYEADKNKDINGTYNLQLNIESEREKDTQSSEPTELATKATSGNHYHEANQDKEYENALEKLVPNFEEINKHVVGENYNSGILFDDRTTTRIIEKNSCNLENIAAVDYQCESSVMQTENLESYKSSEKITLSNLNDGKKNLCNEILVGNESENHSHANETKIIANEVEARNSIIDGELNVKNDKIFDLTKNKDSSDKCTADESTQNNSLKKIKETNGNNTMDKVSSKLVANFSAEFLAGLPNESSVSPIDVEERELDGKNEIDFEFENHCSTPTMCRIDLDVMSENTSDVSASMPLNMLPIKDCEADKLLEDFNNKTENIVGSTLNKKALATETTLSKPINNTSQKVSRTTNNSPALIISNELVVDTVQKMDAIDTEEAQIPMEIKESVPTNDELLMSNKNLINSSSVDVGLRGQESQIVNESKSELSLNSSEENQAENTVSDCDQTNGSATKSTVSIALSESTNKHLNDEKGKESTVSILNIEGINKELKTTKENPAETFKHQSNNSRDIEENEEKSCKHVEQSTKDETMSHQMETSINENQHMTVELGNWKSEVKDEMKNNDSEAGGVSAIFSFPKIPIISISIHTTSNNKTYFKISNRDNQAKDGNKTKKNKASPTDEVENATGEETVITNTLDENETINKEKITSNSAAENNDDDAEKIHREDEQGETEEQEYEDVDNFEIEKFSHDSNSACSLPLKKRPTQADPNGDTEDSQSLVIAGYEQLQEIAAEVVIENNCKDKTILADNTSLLLEAETKPNDVETDTQDQQINIDASKQVIHEEAISKLLKEIDDNKSSTSLPCSKKISDPSTPFKRRVHTPIRSTGQTPIQIVAPQLKDNSMPPLQDHRTTDAQVSGASRMAIQSIQPLPESYPATPMLSVANVEKLMDFNRFIEDLLASPDVVTIIDNANACGYYAEGQSYEMERIAILEHYNIANAKGDASVTKPLYWKKSAGDTISIYNDNDNEWISLPPSTAKQLQKLSFVLSILQQQYKVADVRQRINIALTFLIRNTSKFKNTSSSNLLQQSMPLYSKNVSDLNSSNHNIAQPFPTTSHFRIATNYEPLNTNFNMNQNIESVQDFHSTNCTNNQQQPEHEPAVNSNQNWNNTLQFLNSGAAQANEQTNSVNNRFSSNIVECEQQQQQQQTQTPEKRKTSWDELNNELYINPPCATSPQNEVIVNTNGVELHEIPQDSQNIFISITDESGISNGNSETFLHKYNTRKQQPQYRTLEDIESSTSSSSLAQQSYPKRPCLGNAASLITNHFMRNNVIPTFGNQEINLQNPYRMQQQMTNQNLNTSPSSSFSQRNISQQNAPINIYNSNRHSSPFVQQQQKSQQRISNRFTTSSFNSQGTGNSQQSHSKSNDSNYKEILQPYITYLIKDHEKTSKHLLQVFEEVSNSNPSNGPVNSNLNQYQHQFSSLLPPLIRNPQQNHMPGFHQMTDSCGSVLPSLIRNPHQSTFINRESGALQVVQSFLEQSQTSFDSSQEQMFTDQSHKQQQMFTDQQQQQQASSSLTSPGFVKEYINFVGSRDELTQKRKLRNFHKKQQDDQQQHLNEQVLQQQDPQRLNSLKRKCQERNNKLADDLKRKMVELSLLKHNVQAKLLEKEQQQQSEINQRENCNITTKRRGRPKKIVNKLPIENSAETTIISNNDIIFDVNTASSNQNKCTTRMTRRKQANSDLTTPTTTIDHAYFRQRTAAREAAKRINATVNSNFH